MKLHPALSFLVLFTLFNVTLFWCASTGPDSVEIDLNTLSIEQLETRLIEVNESVKELEEILWSGEPVQYSTVQTLDALYIELKQIESERERRKLDSYNLMPSGNSD